MCAQTVKPKNTWIVVADGHRMRAYEPQKVDRMIRVEGLGGHLRHEEKTEWTLTPVPGMAGEAEPVTDYQAGHDKRGSLYGKTPGTQTTAEPRLDIRDEVKSDFMHAVAAKLKHAHDEGRFGHLIIAMLPRMMGELRPLLDPAVAKCVTAEVVKELTHYGNDELLEHIRHVLPLAHAA